MPAIFSEEQKEKLQISLMTTGFELLKKYGYHRMTIDEVTKSCGIAKGTFYHFFKGKEEFIYRIMLYERDLERKKLTDLLTPDHTLTRDAFKEWLLDMIHDDVNVFSYMSQEEITLLTSAWPEEYLLNVSNDEHTSLWILSMIPDKQKDCDWKIFVNYLKGLAIVNTYKHILNPDAADLFIDRFMDDLIRYVWGMV